MLRPLTPFFTAALLLWAGAATAQNDYPLTPDSLPQPGVPQGEVSRYTWKSKIFPGTVRDYWVYVPKQYDGSKPACVMLFQDGGGFQDRNGGFRVPVVFDNLIAKGEMPVTVAIMVNPGVVPADSPDQMARYNRSYEYDAPTGEYARFLLEEILPEVGKTLKLTDDPNGRAICGASSGGIAAFTAAWERPDAFRRVISFIGSFTNLRGGHLYPSLIRKHEPKPIRIFLQDGSNDQDIYSGSWFIGNNDVAAALKYAGYDYRYVVGTGGHDGRQGTAVLPDALRWVWRGYPAPITAKIVEHNPGLDVLIGGEEWKLAPSPGESIGAVAAGARGDLFISDSVQGRVRRYSSDGKVSEVASRLKGVSDLSYGPDNIVRACVPKLKAVAILNGKERDLLVPVAASRTVASYSGQVYAVDPRSGALLLVGAPDRGAAMRGKAARKIDDGLPNASAMQLSADQSLLFLAQPSGQFVYSYHIEKDGSVSSKQPYFDLYVPYGETGSGASSMATDTQGRLYVATTTGIQVLDQPGRVNGIIAAPTREPVTAIAWGGGNMDTLYAVAGGKLYARRLRAKGVVSSAPPVKLPSPRL